jgi:hypothetical protein
MLLLCARSVLIAECHAILHMSCGTSYAYILVCYTCYCRSSTVAELVRDMKGGDETRKHLALLVIGELGTQSDLSRAQDLRALLLVSSMRFVSYVKTSS